MKKITNLILILTLSLEVFSGALLAYAEGSLTDAELDQIMNDMDTEQSQAEAESSEMLSEDSVDNNSDQGGDSGSDVTNGNPSYSKGGELNQAFGAATGAENSTGPEDCVSSTGECGGKNVTVDISVPFMDGMKQIEADTGIELIQKYASYIYKAMISLVGLIAVLIIIISGVQMMTAGADSSAYEDAKSRITRTFGGLALLFGMAILLYTINPIYFTI